MELQGQLDDAGLVEKVKRFLQPKVVFAWSWFFLLMASYYVLKPLRDGLGAKIANELGWWYLATFIAMLGAMAAYAKLLQNVSTKWLVALVYETFALCMIGFAMFMQGWSEPSYWLTGTFFVWVSVFNLMTVALFWSVMTDVFDSSEGKKWFGLLASAGSVGALTGSTATMYLTSLGKHGLLLVSCICMQITIAIAWCLITLIKKSSKNKEMRQSENGDQRTLERNSKNTAQQKLESSKDLKSSKHAGAQSKDSESGGGLWEGLIRVLGSPYLLALCGYVVLGKFAATFFYNSLQLAFKLSDISSETRTAWFAQMNLTTQIGSMIIQGLFVAWLFRFIGVKGVLAIPCVTVISLLVAITIDPTLSVLIVAQVVQQIAGYGVMTPGQNLLFTVLPRHDRYVSKGFIDTVVFRFSDVLAAQVCTQMVATGIGLPWLSGSIIPFMILWFLLSRHLGKEYDQKAAQLDADNTRARAIVN